ncbi:hypothetical protein D9599_08840 [Roseomonas sp. KE2513]|uniref:bifunctional DNA primase/polymerase n=1 Tax=Roseomonas sp. KE2513 TaxID=2479202 RepID=UPI0018E01246|nr:bifunctional DNA primase/polymerase [Roseomonas sp. KE2513]MBI0535678.1 hypothetical protein [Roseomonas sp. KE2513]
MSTAYSATPYCDPLRLLDQGWHIFPLKPGAKLPAVNGWNALAMVPPSPDQVERWLRRWPVTGWGVACGFCAIGVDNDCDTPDASALFEAVRLTTLGETPAVRIGKPGRSVTLYRPVGPIRYVNLPSVGGEVYALNAGYETGRQIAAFGPHVKAPSGRYVWPVENLHSLRPRDLPPVAAEDVGRFVRTLNLAFVSAGLARPEALREGQPGAYDRTAARAVWRAGQTGGAPGALAEARKLLEAAAAAQAVGQKVARHPLALAVVIEAVNAGNDPEDVAEALGDRWRGLLEHAEQRTRGGEMLSLARWAARKGQKG